MTSALRIAANRESARKSTGPRTGEGKARSSRNALRHGLETVNFGNQEFSENAERIAKAICKDASDPFRFEQAIIIAESAILLGRVRAARIAAIERVRQRAEKERFSRQETELSAPEAREDKECVRRALPELLSLERYERRALSRRRRAILRFDALG